MCNPLTHLAGEVCATRVCLCCYFQNEDIPMADMAYPEPQPPIGGVRAYPGPGPNPPPVSH